MAMDGTRLGDMWPRRLADRPPRQAMPGPGHSVPPGGGRADAPDARSVLSISVQKWLLLLVLSGVAGILLLALYGKWQVERIYGSASYANANTVPRVIALTDARAHFLRWRLALYRHAVNGDPMPVEWQEEAIAHERDATRLALDRYGALATDGKARRDLDMVRALLAEYERETPLADEEIHAGHTKQALNILADQNAAADRVIQALDGQIAANVALGGAADAKAMRIFNRASWMTLAFVLVVVGILLAVGFLVGRRIAAQVDRIRALARDNEMFRAMVECVRDQSVTVHDVDDSHRIVYANAAACRHFGVDLLTLLTWTPADFDPQTGPDKLKRLATERHRHGSILFESEHRIASGELIPVEVASHFLDYDGRRLAVCLTRDLRPRLEAEARMLEMERTEAERESARRLTRFAQSAPGFMFTAERRADGGLAMIYASPAVEDILGLGVANVLADIDCIVALIVPEDHEEFMRRREESFQTLSPLHTEFRIRHSVKGIRWLEANAMSDAMEDGHILWHGFVTDITGRKRMETELAARERVFRTLSEHSPDMIVRYDPECRRIYVNKAFLDAEGVAAEAVLGKPVTALTWWASNMDAQEYERHLRQVLQTGAPVSIRLNGITPSTGEVRNTLARVVPEYGDDGQVESLMAVVREVTDMVNAEQELRQREQYLRALLDNFPFFVWLKDTDSRLLAANREYARVAKVATARELEGRTDFDFFPHEMAQGYVADDRAVLETGQTKNLIEPYRDERGEMRWMETYKSPVAIDGKVLGTVGFSRDVSEQMRLQVDLARRERELRTLVENSPDVIIRYDSACRHIFVSPNYEQVYGIPVAEAQGKRPTEAWLRPSMDPAEYEDRLKRVIETGASMDIELDWHTADGEYVCQSLLAVPEIDATGQVGSVLTLSRDVSGIKRAERTLLAREQEFRTLVERSPDTISRYDAGCRRVYVNPRQVEEHGVPLHELLGRTPAECPGGESAEAYQQRIQQVVASGEPADFELTWRTGDGRELCSHIRLMPEFDRDGGRVTGVLAVGRDITEIDEYRKRIHHLAFYDMLTGLPNRSLLNDRIGQTIADAAYHGHRFGLMVLDLDGFKEVNDTLGHGVGDLLLCEVGERLLGCVRIYDTVARLGGDEFAILLPEVREDGNVGTIARKILDVLAEPFNVGGKELFVSASIGIALYPSDSAEIDGLFRYVDSAMYHAKKQGRNNFQFYSPELTARSGERMALESALRRARKKKELELYYQPQVDITSGRLVGAEALLRWNRGAHGMVTPDRFVPIAEETSLIVDIGEWVLETACEAAVAWNRGRKSPLKVAVNLSTRQFVRNDLAKSVCAILAQTGCKPGWLGLEITESLLLDDAEDIRATLAEFDAMGLSIAIDDFGTGYSALGYLNRFPVSVLKIDRSFVRDMTTDRDRAELVKAIISMARSLRMGLVAEGVETDAQAAYLHNLGCHVAQGYLFGKPMPHAEFDVMLADA